MRSAEHNMMAFIKMLFCYLLLTLSMFALDKKGLCIFLSGYCALPHVHFHMCTSTCALPHVHVVLQ